MSVTTLAAVLFLVLVVTVLVVILLGRRRLPAHPASILFGALACVVAGVPAVVLTLASQFGAVMVPGRSRGQVVVTTIVLAVVVALLHETSRYLFVRLNVVSRPSWEDAVGFGLGYGGLAVLGSFGAHVASVLAVLTYATRENVASGVIGVFAWNALAALPLHVVCTLLVLRAVRERRWTWWWLAVAVHVAFRCRLVVAPALSPTGGVVAVVITAAVVALLLWAVVAGPLSRRATWAGTPHAMGPSGTRAATSSPSPWDGAPTRP